MPPPCVDVFLCDPVWTLVYSIASSSVILPLVFITKNGPSGHPPFPRQPFFKLLAPPPTGDEGGNASPQYYVYSRCEVSESRH